jgi:hypothetical protein
VNTRLVRVGPHRAVRGRPGVSTAERERRARVDTEQARARHEEWLRNRAVMGVPDVWALRAETIAAEADRREAALRAEIRELAAEEREQAAREQAAPVRPEEREPESEPTPVVYIPARAALLRMRRQTAARRP